MHTGSTRFAGLLVTIMLFLTACSQEQASAPEAAAGQAPQAVPVQVAKVAALDMARTKVFTGRLEADQMVTIHPLLSGQVLKVYFEEGALVKQGQPLLEIHSRTQRAELNQLKAELESARAQVELAQRDLDRAKSLRQKNSISQEEVDNRNTELTKAVADAAALAASVQRQEIIVSYTQTKAPFDGRVSSAFVSEGNWVTQGTTALTEIVSTEIFHAYFDVDESTFLELQALSEGKLQNSVLMGFGNRGTFPYQGEIDFVDNKIDPSTGTIRLRAVFEDKTGALTPGMFVRMRVRIDEPEATVLVKDTAIATDLNSKYVLVVDENNTAQYRPVEAGLRYGGLRAISSGLAADEQIIVSGLQRVFPGMPVMPELVDMAEPGRLEALKAEQAALLNN